MDFCGLSWICDFFFLVEEFVVRYGLFYIMDIKEDLKKGSVSFVGYICFFILCFL